jgi:DNA polymerase III delta prime subunit
MERISPEMWCADRVCVPDTDLSKLKLETYWVRMMKSVLPVPELDSVLGIRQSAAFLYCGPAGTGKRTLAQALAGSLGQQGYTCFQVTGADLNEDMEQRLVTLLKQVDADHPTILICQELQGCDNPAALASCIAQMIQLCEQQNLPMVFVIIEEDEQAVPVELMRQVLVCRFALPDVDEREAFYSAVLGKRFPLMEGLRAKDLAVAAEGLTLRQLVMTLRFMQRGLKEQALVRFKNRYTMAQDAIRNKELVVDMPMFRGIVAHVKAPEPEKQPPIQIVQTVAAAPASAPVEQDQPVSKTDVLRQSKNMSDFFNNL